MKHLTFLTLVCLIWLLGPTGRANGQPTPVPTLESCEQDALTLETLINKTKAEVALIAQRALDNEYNCGLLRTCVASRPPAVLACTGVTAQADNLTCVNTVTQPNVTQCYGQACHNEYLGYNTCSTQFPPGTSVGRTTGVLYSSNDYSAAVCKKNFLDLYQKLVVFNRTNTFGNWRYFADAMGIFTKFPFQAVPQTDQSTTELVQCRPYDPRRRPWFAGAISSTKGVVILIDVGATNLAPASSIGLPGGPTRLQLSQETAAAFLDTLSKNDAVAVAFFDSNVTVLGTGRMLPVTSFDVPHVELAALNSSIYNLNTTTQDSSGLDVAIQKGLQLLSTVTNACQKIMIVLSDGQGFGPTLNTSALNLTINTAISQQQQPITTFFVSMGEATTAGNANLQALACGTQGIAMRVQNNDNILYDALPYFNFLARTSQFVNQQYLSIIYPDFSGLGSVFTVAQLVFDNRTNDFLGIAAGDTAYSLVSNLCAEKVQSFLKSLQDIQATCPANITKTLPPCLIEAVRGVNNTYCPAPASCKLPKVGPPCPTPPIPKNILRPPGPAVAPVDNYCCGSCSVATPPGRAR